MNHNEAIQHIQATLKAFGPGEAVTLTQDTWAHLHAAMTALIEQPEQPVAYSVGRTLHWHEGMGIDDAQLFAAPNTRKPLTDEEIDDLSRSMIKGDRSVNWLCRAIERAHGIGEQT